MSIGNMASKLLTPTVPGLSHSEVHVIHTVRLDVMMLNSRLYYKMWSS